MTSRPPADTQAQPRMGAPGARLAAGARRHHPACRIVASCIVLASVVSAVAQDVSAPALKAAFVYQMPKFIEWPTGFLSTGSAFSACILGDPSMADEFERITKGLDYNGHPIAVSRLSAGASVQGCHSLYLSSGTPKIAALVADLQDRPVLTVSDIEGFTKLGGIAQLYFEGGRLRMFINVPGSQRVKLRVSSRLLQLSKEP